MSTWGVELRAPSPSSLTFAIAAFTTRTQLLEHWSKRNTKHSYVSAEPPFKMNLGWIPLIIVDLIHTALADFDVFLTTPMERVPGNIL